VVDLLEDGMEGESSEVRGVNGNEITVLVGAFKIVSLRLRMD